MELLVSTDKQPPRIKVWQMFDRIAERYDLLNHLLSFGQDIRWRKKVANLLPEKPNQTILDLATGTGDQLLYLLQCSDRIVHATGTDLAIEMLARGREKIRQRQLQDVISLLEGDAENIHYRDQSFDVLTIAFGIRNVTDVNKSLAEMYRVLKPGGRVIILEFSLPKNIIIKKLYLLYFRYILPFIGGLISGDIYAYRYLNQTVETFPYGDKFCDLISSQGFREVEMIPLTFGVATIYYADKIIN
jgi:demethylmenaquinone methyltransferase/2-methoxy-6-polyprenyl-1,4-benzoquinol methylase